MMKYISPIALLAALSWAVVSCSSQQPTIIEQDELGVEDTGSARMALTVGDQTITSVTAVISRKHGKFESQTHTIDVTGDSGVVSIFFGSLPVARGYEVTLTAADCSGSAKFDISSGVTTQVPIDIVCPGSSNAPHDTGSVRITGTIAAGSAPSCDIVSKIVAGPATQNNNGPLPKVQLFLQHGIVATNIVWTASSANGGTGTVGNLVGTQDQEVTFDCTTNGLVSLVAAVTASQDGHACTEQARVQIECINQTGSGTAVCGDGTITAPEQCDGTHLPSTAPAGATCNNQCMLVNGTVRCGDGIINQTSEQCDLSALPASAPAGSTCSTSCTLIVPVSCGDHAINGGELCDPSATPQFPTTQPAGTTCGTNCTVGHCGDALINGAEPCDASANPKVPASAPAGSTCSATCTIGKCGDNAINGAELCDPTANPQFPTTPPTGTTCSSACVVIPPGSTCGNGTIDSGEPCDASANPKVPASAPAGSTCSATCTIGKCGDSIINGAELCDPTANPQFPTPPAAGTTCSAACVVVTPPRCGDGVINQASEQCDGTAIPPTAPTGSTCSGFCTLITPIRCGDGIINGTEQCDGTTLPTNPAPAPGTTCSSTCTLVPPTGGTSGKCHHACVEDDATAQCTLEFAALTPASDPVLDCILSAAWPAPNKFPVGSCANGQLLSCYCGGLATGPCIAALPSALTGQCKNEFLAGTLCNSLPEGQQSACVAQRFTLDNVAGRAVNYIACLQNNCHDDCVQ